MRRAAVVASIVAGVILLSAQGVAGDAPTTVGWWTASNPGGPVPTLVPNNQSRADVPAGGFEVATASDAVSYAAIAYTGDDGVQVQRLVLKLAPGGSQLPGSKVQACQITAISPFAPADGDPIASGPKYDCTAPVLGAEDSNAKTVSFDLARLAHGNQVSVAIVGVSPARLVFDKPDGSAVVVTGGAFPEAPPPPAGDIGPVGEESASASLPTTGTSQFSTTPIPDTAAAGQPPVAVPNQLRVGPPSGVANASFATTERDSTGGAGSAVIGFLLILVAAVAVAVRNRRALAIVAKANPQLVRRA